MIKSFFPLKKLRRNGKYLLFGVILIIGAVAVYHEFVAANAWSSHTPANEDSTWRRPAPGREVGGDHVSDLLWRISYTPQHWRPEYKGQANLHIFEDWCGSSTAQLRKNLHYPLYPHSRTTVKKLAVSPRWTNYGLRIFGFLHPYTNGEFVFALSSDDNSEFWLSVDDSPLNLQLLAWVGKTGSEWTAPGEFEKYVSQISRPVWLSEQKKYFFEVIHKQNDRGTDHMEVAWQLNQEGLKFVVISSKHISLYTDESALKMSDVGHVPQTAASHTGSPSSQPSNSDADMLREDPRDTFYQIPLIDHRYLQNVLPDCSYNPSYTIKGFPLLRYQGLQFVHMSYIYPNDYTRLTQMEAENTCFYHESPLYLERFGFSRYMRLDRPEGLERVRDFGFNQKELVPYEEEEEEEPAEEAQLRARLRQDRENAVLPDYGDDYDDYTLKRKRKLFSVLPRRPVDGPSLRGNLDTVLHTGKRRRKRGEKQKQVQERRPEKKKLVKELVVKEGHQLKPAEGQSETMLLEQAEKPTEGNRLVHAERPAEGDQLKPVKRPEGKTAERNGLKPEEEVVDGPAERPVQRDKLKPSERATEKPAPGDKLKAAERPAATDGAPSREGLQKPAEKTVERVQRPLVDLEPSEGRRAELVQDVKHLQPAPAAMDASNSPSPSPRTMRGRVTHTRLRQPVVTSRSIHPLPETPEAPMGRLEPRILTAREREQERQRDSPPQLVLDAVHRGLAPPPAVTTGERGGSQVRREKGAIGEGDGGAERGIRVEDQLWGLDGEEEAGEDDMAYDLTPAPVFDPEVNWDQTFQVTPLDLQMLRSDWIDLRCNVSGNLLMRSSDALPIVKTFIDKLNKRHLNRFSLVRVVNVERRVDGAQGSRYLLELELKDLTGQLLRLSHFIYALIRRPRSKGKQYPRRVPETVLCNPVGFHWNPTAMVHFIVPVKNQARWVQQLIVDMEDLYRETQDPNFNLIITDYNSTDMDVEKALLTSTLPRYQYVKLSGNFERSAGLQAGINLITDEHTIVFLCDLHIHFPPTIIDAVRKHCVEGHMGFAPIVMRLDCGATPAEPRGYWEVNGFGLLGLYKSDLDAAGGMNTKDFKDRWGGEDWELLDRLLQSGLEVERIYLRNFMHHYHSKRGMWNRRTQHNNT
ncbi:beta-1,4-N-acetylgalactosaminyltransferase 3 isoform X1 [Osmerus eperlanus]|uniref:beta-1,4-N-acetylgalactosaminyltransferase 3 isoform X1 n=1 Tax=Osmerus eperlanus TaxID=29151 RepID=UPI002E1594C0